MKLKVTTAAALFDSASDLNHRNTLQRDEKVGFDYGNENKTLI